MKYFTTNLYFTMGFYDFFPDFSGFGSPPGNIKKTYQGCIDALVKRNAHYNQPRTFYQVAQGVQDFYEECVNRFLHDHVQNYSHIVNIIFNKSGELLPFSETYEQLTPLYLDYASSLRNAITIMRQEAQLAAKVSSCDAITHLSKLQHHDSAILSVQQTAFTLSLKLKAVDNIYKTNHLLTFQLVNTQISIDYKRYTNWIILYEEVCIASSDAYEYNLLITNFSDGEPEYEEISICFRSVKLEHTI